MKQAAPGKDWKMGNGHEIEMEYLTNTNTTEVRHYKVSLVKSQVLNTVTYEPTLIDNGYYGLHELYKTVTRDENHSGTDKDHTTEEYTNKQGQVVLKRTYENDTAHDTYYVYDDFGNLTFVLPPKSEAHTAQPDATELSELCYQYKYDHRNRLVEKKIPGKGWESIIYNRLDQPVMTQDKELKNANKWLVTKYDIFGRVVYTGIKNTNGSRTDFQNIFNNSGGTIWETKNSIGTGFMNTYYTSNVFPTTLDEIHTINYYDNYYFDLNGGLSESSYGITPITNVKGLATGSKVRVLGTNDWITTVTYYNEESRPIYVYSKNDYLGSIDKIKSELTFDGAVLETTSSHNKNFHTIDVKDKYTYDHMNRLTLHTQLLNNAALPEVISNNKYDDLGQLVKKGVGNKENVTSRLQDVDFEYNIRGWLKRINTINELEGDLFSFEIEYNTPSQSGADGLFNGNISQINWQTESDEVLYSYVYEYDALNRIKGAGFYGQNSNNRYNLNNISYDKNGNILSLTRNGHVVASPDGNISSHFGVMDQLTYTYENSSNRLKKVDDSANTTYGFKDGSNTTTEYTYDNNGNMLTDANKGITSISYNHLNLPTNVSLPGGNITYIYDATGVKQKKIVSTGNTTEYAGNYIYENGTLKMFSHAEGYVEPIRLGKLSQFNYIYQYKDHLGNIRLTYMDKNQNNKSIPVLEIIEENNYYPFGGLHKGYNNVVSANSNSVAQKFKYNGKEMLDELGLDMYDYGARMYDTWTGRWNGVDPHAEDYFNHSPYHYAGNNPIMFVDYDGKDYGITIDHKKKTIVISANFYFDNKNAMNQNQKAIDSWAKMTGTYTTKDGIDYAISFDLNSSVAGKGQKAEDLADKDSKGNYISELSDPAYAKEATAIFGSVKFKSLKKQKNAGITRNSKKIYNKTSLATDETRAHEIGHIFGLGENVGGVMDYKSSYSDMTLPQTVNLKSILKKPYQRFKKNGKNLNTGGTTTVLPAKLGGTIEVIGTYKGGTSFLNKKKLTLKQ
ncbi:MAG: RHS repeat-associated core domain-containing protein [Winogradskyella sp.]|uniref:RHS repeat domain-containing protein n=1 Tax=Winogradskyella sp. TaxID=1883156 RepID=UPI0025EEA3F5|nr:RHS repeat-associated core domain-containing protein [Winogradskyella sp.]NRB61370.1 RHS repeat-associated core domain-containing protein [Winogradskyella sp.]